MPTHNPPPRPQGHPPRPIETAHTEHLEDSFTTSQIVGYASLVILVPLLIWGLKLAITRALTQSDKDAKQVNDRLDQLEKDSSAHALELAKRPTYEQLSHAKTELRDEFRRRQ